MASVKQNGDISHCPESNSPEDTADVIDDDPRKVIVREEELTGKLTFWLAFSTVIVSFGAGAQMGYNAGGMTVCAPFIREFLNATNYDKWNGHAPDLAISWIYSCTVTVFSVGGAFGAMAAGKYSDALGRKKSMIFCSFMSPLAGLLMGISQITNIYGLLFLGRLVVGLYQGFTMVIMPVYLAEISPINLRGAVGTFSMFVTCLGQLLSHIIGFWGFYDQQLWPIFLSLTGAFGMLIVVAFPFCPESPRWLYLRQKRYKEAEVALQMLRGSSADITAELEEMRKEELKEEANRVTEDVVGVMDILRFRNPEWKMPLLLCVVATLGFHFSGISAIFFYTTEIYTTAGLEQSEIAVATVVYSSINVVCTVLGVFLVDRIGRRPLLLYPMSAALVILLGITVSINTQDDLPWMKWVTILLIFIFTALFGIGPVGVKNIIAAELWMQSTRPAAMSIFFQATWWAMTFVSLTFPLLNDSIGGYTFLIYLFCLMAATFFLFRNLPETKNRTFEQIAANFTKPQHEKSSLVCSSFNQADCNDADSLARDNGGVVKETDIDTVTLVTT